MRAASFSDCVRARTVFRLPVNIEYLHLTEAKSTEHLGWKTLECVSIVYTVS